RPAPPERAAPATPGMCTSSASGAGQAAAVNADGSVNDPNHPAKAGDLISLYATGAGQTNPASQDGARNSTTPPFPLPVLPVSATVGGKSVTPQYAGAAPGLVAGVIQVNLQIPAGLTPGAVQAVLQVGTSSSPNGVTIYVQ